jgi:DNA-binding MarR family transcriptional regulator
MANLIKLSRSIKNISTYRVGLLQAKAYRILKQNTAKLLEPQDLSTLDWALIGILYDSKEGRRMSTLASLLGVEPPLITRMIMRLEKKEIVRQKKDYEDVRAKVVTITSEGQRIVKKTEKILRAGTKELFHGVSIKDLLYYIFVLEKIVENNEKIQENFVYKK